MVKLPSPFEQAGRAVGERGSSRAAPRSHHNWGARFGRNREAAKREPRTLLELEALAKQAAVLMDKHSPDPNNYNRAMELLRLQYNMNYLLVCEKCHGTHDQDELIAPER